MVRSSNPRAHPNPRSRPQVLDRVRQQLAAKHLEIAGMRVPPAEADGHEPGARLRSTAEPSASIARTASDHNPCALSPAPWSCQRHREFCRSGEYRQPVAGNDPSRPARRRRRSALNLASNWSRSRLRSISCAGVNPAGKPRPSMRTVDPSTSNGPNAEPRYPGPDGYPAALAVLKTT